MDCAEGKELLSALLDGESSAEESRRIAEHLAVCAECRASQQGMRALDTLLARSEAPVSPDFREKLFARMEAEDLLPRRRSLVSLSIRWALPLAAAAAMGLFLLISEEAPKTAANSPNVPKTSARIEPASPEETRAARNRPDRAAPSASGPSAVAGREELTPEEREIVAYLEVLEDPASFEESAEIDEMEIFLPAAKKPGVAG